MTTMSILHTDDNGMMTVVFEPMLLEHIQLRNNAGILSILQDVNPCQLSDGVGMTLLHLAAEYGNDEFARYLIDLGAKVDAQNLMEETPLMLAINANEPATVHVLLEAGADIFIPNANGQCSLGIAFRCSSLIVEEIFTSIINKVTIESLIASEYVASNVFHHDCPLYRFISLDNAEITRVLLEKGSPINVQNPYSGASALHEAVRLNCLENVKLLLNHGANVNAEEQKGKTPLDYIWFLGRRQESRMLEMIKILIAAGATLFNSLTKRLIVAKILELGTKEMVRSVLQSPLDLQLVDRRGLTPLHYIFKNHRSDILGELRDLDFDVNTRDQNRCTILHYAVFRGNAHFVKFLVDRGADVNARDSHGQTPLFFVADPTLMFSHNHVNDYVNCIEILLDYGADPHMFMVENCIVMRVNYQCILDKIITPIIAKLVLLEACGRPINIFVRNWIETYGRFKLILDSVTLQLSNMKKIEVHDSMTLFDFMITKKISWFAHNKKLVQNLYKIIKDFNPKSSYHYMLNQRFWKFNQVIERRDEFEFVINEVFTKFSNLSVCNVAEKIVDYLQDINWRETA